MSGDSIFIFALFYYNVWGIYQQDSLQFFYFIKNEENNINKVFEEIERNMHNLIILLTVIS